MNKIQQLKDELLKWKSSDSYNSSDTKKSAMDTENWFEYCMTKVFGIGSKIENGKIVSDCPFFIDV